MAGLQGAGPVEARGAGSAGGEPGDDQAWGRHGLRTRPHRGVGVGPPQGNHESAARG